MLFASDTSPEARAVLLAILRGQAPERRLQIALAATDAAREMIRADLRERFPGASDEELHERFLERWLGAEVAGPVIAHRRAHARPAGPGA